MAEPVAQGVVFVWWCSTLQFYISVQIEVDANLGPEYDTDYREMSTLENVDCICQCFGEYP